MKRKQLLKTKRSDGGVEPKQYDSLDDILPTAKTPMQMSGGGTSSTRVEPSSPQADSDTPPSTSSEEKRDIMKPQIQNICGDCHSTCLTCASSAAESECLACQQGLTFIAHHATTSKNNTNGSSNATTGVCVSPISQANQSVIHTFNAHLIWISMGILAILALLVAIIVALVRLPKGSSTKNHAAKLRDSYTYDRVNDSALLSDYDDGQVLDDDDFLTYKELKSKFNDMPSTDEEDNGDDQVEGGVDHGLPRDLTRVV